jgi:hypothetical protein
MTALVRQHLPEVDSQERFAFLQTILEEPTGAYLNPDLQPDNRWQSIAILLPNWQDLWVHAEQRDRIISCDDLAVAWDCAYSLRSLELRAGF